MVAEKRRGSGCLIFFIAVAALFIFTNPNEKMHLDFAKERIIKEIEKDPSYSGGIRFLELAVGDDNINILLKDYIRRNNFVFFSLTETQFEGKKMPALKIFRSIQPGGDLQDSKNEIIAIGILGNIFPLDEVQKSFDRVRIRFDL